MAKSGRKKGSIPWNKGLKTGLIPKTAFKKGNLPWHTGTKGKKAAPKTAFKKGIHSYPDVGFKKGQTPWNKGTKNLVVGWNKGKTGLQTAWNKGKKFDYKPHPGQIGKVADDKNPNWKGDKVGYRSLHHWIQRKLGKAVKCGHCGIIGIGRQVHWANKSGSYQRNPEDFISLCIKCHGKYDKERRKLLRLASMIQ